MDTADAQIQHLLVRADDVWKAAPSAAAAAAARQRAESLLEQARALLPEVSDDDRRLALAGAVARRFADIDRLDLDQRLRPTPGMRTAPTTVADPTRVPPGQRLTPGFPVLHVGRAPDLTPDDVRVAVTGRVRARQVLDWSSLQALPEVTVTRDFHCVTGWSRLDNAWTGVRVRDVLATADVRPEATHAIVSGHPAYSANLPLEQLTGGDVLLAWAHDGRPLPRQHGGPLRLVVPALYGWKSVKWVFEIRLTERDVRGYWEERGYHDLGDPFREQRFRDGA